MTSKEQLERLEILALTALRQAGFDIYRINLRTETEPIPCLYMDDCRIYPGQAPPELSEHVDWLPDYAVFHRDQRLGVYGSPCEAVKAAVLALVGEKVDAALQKMWARLTQASK